MNLKSLFDIELLNGVRCLRGDERKLDRQIVEYICEIESRRLYAELGYANVIDWLVKDLGYSESSAYRRMMAARAIRAVPEAAEKIEDGRLNLVTLAKVQSAIRSEEKRTGERVSLETRSTIIAQTENKTLRETVRLVAEKFPESVQISGAQIGSTQILLTEEQLALLERVRELKSHSNFGASLGEIVASLATEYLDRNDPLRREMKPRSMRKKLPITSLVKSSEKPHEKTSEESATHPFEKHIADVSEGSSQGGTSVVFGPETRMRGGARRASIAPSTRNFVRRRAGDACEYQGPDGHRCGSRFQTQTDHVIPLALGGTNDVTNLRLLCRTLDLLMAEKTLGRTKMSQFRKPY
jgi:hypothetical protein